MGWKAWAKVAGLVLTALLGWAWHDGGREPVRPLEAPVALPETAR